MKPNLKLGVLLVLALVLAACPFAATAGESVGVFTVFRVLVGTPEPANQAAGRVLEIPGPFVMLGASPEQEARDVLQLMGSLKNAYRLADVTLAGTSARLLLAGEPVSVPVPASGEDVRVSLLSFDSARAAYSVSLPGAGERPSSANVVIARGVLGNVVDCGSYLYYAFDMDGRTLASCKSLHAICEVPPGLDPNQLPFATQKVPISNATFDRPGPYGFLLLVLPPSYGPTLADPTPDDRGYRGRPYMGWAGVQSDFGAFSAGAEAITAANALCFPGQVLPDLGVGRSAQPVRRHLPSR